MKVSQKYYQWRAIGFCIFDILPPAGQTLTVHFSKKNVGPIPSLRCCCYQRKMVTFFENSLQNDEITKKMWAGKYLSGYSIWDMCFLTISQRRGTDFSGEDLIQIAINNIIPNKNINSNNHQHLCRVCECFPLFNNFISLIWSSPGNNKKGKWSPSVVSNCATPWTAASQAPLSMGFSRQKYWTGLPFPSPGDLPDPGIEPRSPALQADALVGPIFTPILQMRKLRQRSHPRWLITREVWLQNPGSYLPCSSISDFTNSHARELLNPVAQHTTIRTPIS